MDAKQRWRDEHRAEISAYNASYHAAHAEQRRADQITWAQEHPELKREAQKRFRQKHGPDVWRRYGQKIKAEMVAAYGGACACCGETELAFLSLDHILGGGTEHRRIVGQSRLIRQLRNEGWPQGPYRILCMNCQFGTLGGRTCPHQRMQEKLNQ